MVATEQLIMRIEEVTPAYGRRIGAGRTPSQDRGTGSIFSGNPPKKSLGSIGATPGTKTASIGSQQQAIKSPTIDSTPNTPGTTGTIGTTGTTGTKSAADMRNSLSNNTAQNMQNTPSNQVEPEELKSGDKLEVKVEPGSKNVKLVYPDKNEVEVPRDLLRLQQLAGMQ